jgi:hypothetical protein
MTRVASAAVLCLLWASAVFAAQTPSGPPKIVDVRVGFAGHYKAGLWTPVVVTLRGGGEPVAGQLRLVAPDGDGVPSCVVAPAQGTVQIEPGQETRVAACVRIGRRESQLAVELRSGERLLARRVFDSASPGQSSSYPPALLSGQELIVVVGMAATVVQEAVGLLGQRAEEKAAVVEVEDLRELPDRWLGYEGVDAVVLGTGDPKRYTSLEADGPRITALDQWTRQGGKLLLSVGAQGEEILKPQMPLNRFAPGRLDKMVTLRQTAALETYCGSATAITAVDGGRMELHVPLLRDVSGSVEAREANLPLVVRRPVGFGQVIFAAVGFDQRPLIDWPDNGLLINKLLDQSAARAEEVDENRAVMHFGFADMAGQLRSALDHFRGVRLVPFWLVVAIVLVYILAIGPGDYFFLRKLVRRMEWTWLTFPLIVLAVSLGAYWLAGWLKGDRILVNEIDLVDVDTETGLLRGTAWANLFSPQNDRYNLSVEAKTLGGRRLNQASLTTAWLGLPGASLGGMEPKNADPLAWKTAYGFSPALNRMEGVPIQIWSTKSLTARWTAEADTYPTARLRTEERQPVGTITNTLDVPLTDCLLAYGNWAYDLGTIAPGQSVQIGPMLPRRELRTLLTGRHLVADKEDKYRDEITPYDQGSVDLVYVLRAMMFFEASGGSRYTRLLNRYQEFVDLSDLLKTDRAILVALPGSSPGRAERSGAELLRDGQPLASPANRHRTIYRFVFPVTPEEGG